VTPGTTWLASRWKLTSSSVNRALDQLAQRLDDRLEALAVESEVGELRVDLDRAAKLAVLGVDDPLQDRVHDLEVGDVRRDPDQRDLEFVRLAEACRRGYGEGSAPA